MPDYSWNRAATQAKVKAGQQLRFVQGQGYWVGPKLAAAKPKAAPVTPLQGMIDRYTAARQTPQQQLTLAQQLVNTSIASQKAEIEEAARKTQLEAGKQAEASRGFALALGGMDKATAQQAKDAYASAGNDITGFGTALAAALGKAQQGQIGQAQAAVGDRTGDIVQAVDPSAYTAAQNFDNELLAATPSALGKQYSIGGGPLDPLNPSSSPLATSSQQRLASLGNQYVSKGLEARTAAGEQEAKLAGTVPGLVQQALQTIQSSGRADDAALIQALYLMETQGTNVVKNRAGVAAVTGVDPVTGKATVDAKTKAAQIEAGKETNRINRIKANTAKIAAETARINAKAAAQAKIDAATKTKDESTKSFRATYGTNALKYLYTVLGVDVKHVNRGPKERPPKKAELVRAIYGVHGAPFAGKYGLTEAQLKGWANKVVESLPKDWWSEGYWKRKNAAIAAAAASAGPLKH